MNDEIPLSADGTNREASLASPEGVPITMPPAPMPTQVLQGPVMPPLPIELQTWQPKQKVSVRAVLGTLLLLPAFLPVLGIPFAIVAFALGSALVGSLAPPCHPTSITLARVARTTGWIVLLGQVVLGLILVWAGVSIVHGYEAMEAYRAKVWEEWLQFLETIWNHFFS